METKHIIDPLAIQSLRDLSPNDNDAFLREMIGIFLADTPMQIAELEKSLKSSDRAVFMRAAHSIKGSSSNLGAGPLRDATERAENDSAAAPIPQLAPLVAEIGAEFARARAELERIIAAGPDGQ